MIPEYVQEKLQFFNSNKYKLCNKEVLLEEKKKYGEVLLKCLLERDTLVFDKAENNTLAYLDESIKHAKKSPDAFLFEIDDDGKWILHVMEFKKTINTDTIEDSKIQLTMGIYNARAIAGFLNIKIKHIYVYSAYRRDTITEMSPELMIAIRASNSNPEAIKIIREWREGKCSLKIDLEDEIFEHIKIKLDEDGNGECQLHKM